MEKYMIEAFGGLILILTAPMFFMIYNESYGLEIFLILGIGGLGLILYSIFYQAGKDDEDYNKKMIKQREQDIKKQMQNDLERLGIRYIPCLDSDVK